MQTPTLTTDRLTLRPHRLEDFDDYAALWASDTSKYMGGPKGRDDAWAAFGADIAGWHLFGHGAWAIERTEDGAHLGQVAINKPPHFPEVELGWLLYPGNRGKGYAFEAAKAAQDFARDTLKLSTLVSYTDADNTASRRVAIALGARLDSSAKSPDAEDLVYRHWSTA